MKIIEITVEESGGRLDAFISSRAPELSRSRIKKLMEEGLVTVNGSPARASKKVAAGETVRVEIPAPAPDRALPEDIHLEVVYEDEWLAAIAKPKGLVVHPAPGHPTGTLVNALLHLLGGLSGVGGVLRPGIVHRLDKDTSGVILVAKDDATHRALQSGFKTREVEKVYLAVVLGTLSGEGVIDSPIGRSPQDRKKMAANAPRSRHAVTRWRALSQLRGATLVEVSIETGRTHQIRVHMASIGHPVAGDQLYGGTSRARGIMDGEAKRVLVAEKSQALHAWRIGFSHPKTGAPLSITAPVPEELLRLIRRLGGDFPPSTKGR